MVYVTREEYKTALFVLEVLRDDVNTTDDETEVVNAAHTIAQEYARNDELFEIYD